MSRQRRSPLVIAAQVAVLVVLLGGAAFLAIRGFERDSDAQVAAGSSAAPATPPTADVFSTNPTLLVVTDSIGGGADPTVERNYPQVLAETFGFNLVLDAMGGRGYLPSDFSNIGLQEPVPPMIDNLEYDSQNFKAEYVVIDGGRNDLGKDPAQTTAAIDAYYTQIRQYYPDAKIFAMVPAYISPERAVLYEPVANGVRASAEKIGATVIDPIAEGWYTGDLKPLMYKDNIHLNAAGAAYYAGKIAEAMERAGVTPADSSKVGVK